VSESDSGGGAALAAWKIHTNLAELGHSSRMLVGRKLTDDPDVRRLKRNVAWRGADRAVSTVTDLVNLQYVLYPSSFGVALDPWYRNADLVHLHNTHGSYFSHTALPLLTRRKPTVWLLQDMWAFTGHVAYSQDCERWKLGCGNCPYLHEYPSLRHDTTALLWRVKKWAYAHSKLTLAAPSRWMVDLVRASPLLNRFDVRLIHNAVDTTVFRPRDQAGARNRLGLPPKRKTVLFVATDLAEPRKGLRLLEDALLRLANPPLLVLAGGGEVELAVEAHRLGSVRDPEALVDAYAAADVFAIPTVADVLPHTAVESLAVGTPCIAFDRGGITDVVRHLETGYQAAFADTRDLASGIELLLDNDDLRARLSRRCREVAENEFALTGQVAQYADLYQELVREA
jgi:glycosyltransferase involved in cell wall biosynthesis